MDEIRRTSPDLPEWMTKENSFLTGTVKDATDRDTFINKSILSLLGILSKIKRQDTKPPARYHVNAVFKVFFTLVLVISLSISGSFTFVMIVNVYLLVILSMMEAKDIVRILKLSLAMAAFTLIILLPAAFWGNSYSFIMITSKVFATVTAVNILSHSTRWNSITNAMKRFLVPDLFILVLDITIKYIVMLGDFALNMLYALKLRSVGKNRNKYTSLSGIGGTMFIKSGEMAEDMYHAMECRGFTGEYHVARDSRFSAADFLYIMANAGILFVFFYLERA